MTRDEAAEVGMYAAELFRYVTTPQQTAVAELMILIPDDEDEMGNITQYGCDVGKAILRTLAAGAGDEQRLHLTEVSRAVNGHLRRRGVIPPGQEARCYAQSQATMAARQDDDAAYRWATALPPAKAKELFDEALTQVAESCRYLFAGKTLATSKTLRMLAMEHHRKATAFD